LEDRGIMEQLTRVPAHQRVLGALASKDRNGMLLAMATALEQHAQRLFAANRKDIAAADQAALATPLRKRLVFDEKKLAGVCDGIRQVASLRDPIGRIRERRLLDDQLLLERVDVPIGVIGMVFESRPDALVQIISLCLKSGNAIILKGGREALNTNRELVAVIGESLQPFAAGSAWIVHLESREDVRFLLELDDIVDLLIPRGSNEFVRYIMDNTKIPVLGHADGICALYVDSEAPIDLAVTVAVDSKCQYPAVCNAVETVLVHAAVAPTFLPRFKEALAPWSVIIHGDRRVGAIIECIEAVEDDWDTEYLGYEIAIRIVDSLQEAMDHIAAHGSGHTDCIVTSHEANARKFMREVDSADVFWNCSTRFADGFRYGLGAEVGVSTQKIHARGPVGLDGLVIGKWLLSGNGHIVDTYEKGRAFKHEELPLEGVGLLGEVE